jgi:hypothetical protein
VRALALALLVAGCIPANRHLGVAATTRGHGVGVEGNVGAGIGSDDLDRPIEASLSVVMGANDRHHFQRGMELAGDGYLMAERMGLHVGGFADTLSGSGPTIRLTSSARGSGWRFGPAGRRRPRGSARSWPWAYPRSTWSCAPRCAARAKSAEPQSDWR